MYLNYAEGLEQGGSASPLGGAPFLPPRQTKQVELGTKWDFGGVGVTAALFDMKRPLETLDATGHARTSSSASSATAASSCWPAAA